MKDVSYSQFVPVMVREVPALAALLTDHVAFHGEVLPHIFMYDVAMEVVASLHPVREGRSSVLVPGDALRVLHLTELALSATDLEVANVVQISFLDNLMKFKVELNELLPDVGPCSREYLLENYRP